MPLRLQSFWKLQSSESGSTNDDSDRRVWVRIPCVQETHLLATTSYGAETIHARVADISRGGIGLIVDRPVHGGMLNIELPRKPDQKKCEVLAYIRRIEQLANNQWLLGCAFAGALEDEILAELSDGSRKTAPRDRRSSQRKKLRGTANYYPVGSNALSRRLEIVDISLVGIGLLSTQYIEPGDVLNLEIQCADAPPFSILASVVVATQREEETWLVGCRFIRELQEAEFTVLIGASATDLE